MGKFFIVWYRLLKHSLTFKYKHFLMKFLLFCLPIFTTLQYARAQPLTLQFPISHSGLSITNAMYSANGKLLLTQQDGDKAFLWDAYSNKLIRELSGVRKSSFSNDGTLLLLQYPAKVEVLETSSLKTIFIKKITEDKNIEDALFGNKNEYLHILTASGWPVTRELETIAIKDARQVFLLQTTLEFPRLANNNNGSLFAISNFNGKNAIIYNALTGQQAYNISSAAENIRNLCFSPDGRWLAAIADNKVLLWDAADGKLKNKLSGHKMAINDISFSNNSNFLVSGGMDKSVKTWNVSSGKVFKEFTEEEEVYRVAFTKLDHYLLTGYQYFGLNVWDIKKETKHRNLYTGMAKFLNGNQATPDEKLIFASMYGGAKMHKLSNGEELYEFASYTEEIDRIRLSHDKKMLLSLNGQNGMDVWDLQTGKFLAGMGMPDTMRFDTQLNDAIFSSDNKTIIAGFQTGDLGAWDIASGRYLGTYLATNLGNITQLTLNSKKDLLLLTGVKGVSLYQLQPLKELFSFSKDKLEIFNAAFNPAETQLIINTYKDQAFVLNASDGSLINSITKNDFAGTPLFTPDGKMLVMVTSNAYTIFYDPATGKEINKFKTWPRNFNPEGANISPDGKNIYISIGSHVLEENRSIEIHDSKTGALVKALPGLFFKKIEFIQNTACILATPDGIEKRSLPDFNLLHKTAGTDFLVDESNNRLLIKNKYSTEIYRLDNFSKQVNYIGIGKRNGPKFQSMGGITFLSTGYYMGSKEGVSKLHYLRGLQPVGFEQLDILYNRPDKVQEFLGSDAAATSALKKAYYKRLTKLGIDSSAITEKYSVPLADFGNRQQLDAEQEKDELSLQIIASDSAANLTRYNVWVNEVPVYGRAGIDLSPKKSRKLDTRVTITLSKGANKIETAVTNANGIESYKLPLYVYQGSRKTGDKFGVYQAYDATKPIEEYVYFVGIGINRFAEGKNNLAWSVKDIRDLCLRLKEKYGEAFKADTLFDEMVTVENIKALKQKLLLSKVNDKVIVAYSGHGLLSKTFDYYLSTYAVNFEDPAIKGLAYEELEDLVNGIPARKKLLLIDACHSGEVDKEEMEKLKMMAVSDTSKTKGAKGVEPLFTQGSKKLGMKNSFELMQQLFVNVGRSTGATVISAAAGTQFALERGDLKNGVFTYAILEAMKTHSTIKISELKKIVGLRVEELTKGLQKPTSRNETIAVDWDAW